MSKSWIIFFFITLSFSSKLFSIVTEKESAILKRYSIESKMDDYYKDIKSIQNNFTPQNKNPHYDKQLRYLAPEMLLWGAKNPRLDTEGRGFWPSNAHRPPLIDDNIFFDFSHQKTSGINLKDFVTMNSIKHKDGRPSYSQTMKAFGKNPFFTDENIISNEFINYCKIIYGEYEESKTFFKKQRFCKNDPAILSKNHILTYDRYKERRKVFVQRCLSISGDIIFVPKLTNKEPLCQLKSNQTPKGHVYVPLSYDIQTNILGKNLGDDMEIYKAWCHHIRQSPHSLTVSNKVSQTNVFRKYLNRVIDFFSGNKNFDRNCPDKASDEELKETTPCYYYDFITNYYPENIPERTSQKRFPEIQNRASYIGAYNRPSISPSTGQNSPRQQQESTSTIVHHIPPKKPLPAVPSRKPLLSLPPIVQDTHPNLNKSQALIPSSAYAVIQQNSAKDQSGYIDLGLKEKDKWFQLKSPSVITKRDNERTSLYSRSQRIDSAYSDNYVMPLEESRQYFIYNKDGVSYAQLKSNKNSVYKWDKENKRWVELKDNQPILQPENKIGLYQFKNNDWKELPKLPPRPEKTQSKSILDSPPIIAPNPKTSETKQEHTEIAEKQTQVEAPLTTQKNSQILQIALDKKPTVTSIPIENANKMSPITEQSQIVSQSPVQNIIPPSLDQSPQVAVKSNPFPIDKILQKDKDKNGCSYPYLIAGFIKEIILLKELSPGNDITQKAINSQDGLKELQGFLREKKVDDQQIGKIDSYIKGLKETCDEFKQKTIEFQLDPQEIIHCDIIKGIDIHLDSVLGNWFLKSFGNKFKSFREMCYGEIKFSREKDVGFLVDSAKKFFDSYPKTKEEKFSDVFTENDSNKDIIEKLLKRSQDIVLGEVHSDISAKKFLIENLDTLKKENAVIALEHIIAYPYQEMLDDYILGKTNTMPQRLSSYLDVLDNGHNVKDKRYGFKALVEAAKQKGIRIIAIETDDSYSIRGGLSKDDEKINDRYRAMNYLDKMITDQKRDGHKVVHFVGSAHVHTRHGIPGVSELMKNAPTIVISDGKKRSVQTNVDKGEDGIKANIHIIEDTIPDFKKGDAVSIPRTKGGRSDGIVLGVTKKNNEMVYHVEYVDPETNKKLYKDVFKSYLTPVVINTQQNKVNNTDPFIQQPVVPSDPLDCKKNPNLLLEKPEDAITTEQNSFSGPFKIGMSSTIGHPRTHRYNNLEDAHVVKWYNGSENPLSSKGITQFGVIGVFDGHGGSKVSNEAAKIVPEAIKDFLNTLEKEALQDENKVKEILENSFAPLEVNYKNDLKNYQPKNKLETIFDRIYKYMKDNDIKEQGSTAIVAVILNNKKYIINLGDSRAIFIPSPKDANQTLFETVDQKPTDDNESKSIINANGYISEKRVDGALAVARALGDHEYHVGRRPVVEVLGEDRKGTLILECDGVSETVKNDQVSRIIQNARTKNKTESDVADEIVRTAMECGSTDNISVINMTF